MTIPHKPRRLNKGYPGLRLVKAPAPGTILSTNRSDILDLSISGVASIDIFRCKVGAGWEEFELFKGDIAIAIKNSSLKNGDLIVRKDENNYFFDRFTGVQLRLIYAEGKKIKQPKTEKEPEIVGKITHIVRAV